MELQELVIPPAPSLMRNLESPLVNMVTCAVLDTLLISQVGYLEHVPVISFGAETEGKQEQLTFFI